MDLEPAHFQHDGVELRISERLRNDILEGSANLRT